MAFRKPFFDFVDEFKMVDKQDNSSVHRCIKCGDTVPDGKTLCWCCEHGPKLHTATNNKCTENVGFLYKKIHLGVTQ